MMTLLVFPTRHTIQDQSTNVFYFDTGVPFPNIYIYIYITYANWLVHHSNLSETVWYPPDLSEPSNLSDHPELSASPIFEGGHLPDKLVQVDKHWWITSMNVNLWPPVAPFTNMV